MSQARRTAFSESCCEAGLKWALCDTPATELRTMKYYTFEIVIEKEAKDDGYMAYSPSLPGCFSNGRTIEDTKRNIREAIQQHLQSSPANRQSLPRPSA